MFIYADYDIFVVKGTVSGGGRQTAVFTPGMMGALTAQGDSYSITIADQDDAWFGYLYHSGTTGYIKFRGRSNTNGKIEAVYAGKIVLEY